MIDDLHFLRPLWLLALLPAAAVAYALWRRADRGRTWRRAVAAHLLPHLIERPGKASPLRPNIVFAVMLPVSVLALAGPSWQREPAPFVKDGAALVIALELTPTMLAQDIQPSRLDRAVQKLTDLLDRRGGSSTALIAYAGSAHLVMPLTTDASIITTFAAELTPDLMPVEGDAPSHAVALARRLIESSGGGGSVLLITDGISAAEIGRLDKALSAGAPRVHVFGVAAGPDATVPAGSPPAPALDEAALEAAARAGGGKFVLVTPDDSDVRRLTRTVETDFTPARGSAENGARWKDAGYWLVPLVALACLLWFRRGWTVRWSAAAGLALALGLGTPGDARADDGDAPRGWFQTRDQLAQHHFDAGRFTAAAELFTSPLRQGAAWYRAGDFKRAATAFGRADGADALFNRGNALVMQGLYSAAAENYTQALTLRPGWTAAETNRQLAILRAKMLDIKAEGDEGTGGKLGADKLVFDLDQNDAKNAGEKTVAGAGDELTDAELRGLWLRRVETKPADFLRSKFRFQHALNEREKGGSR